MKVLVMLLIILVYCSPTYSYVPDNNIACKSFIEDISIEDELSFGSIIEKVAKSKSLTAITPVFGENIPVINKKPPEELFMINEDKTRRILNTGTVYIKFFKNKRYVHKQFKESLFSAKYLFDILNRIISNNPKFKNKRSISLLKKIVVAI